MSKESSKSTSTGASNSTRRTSQPLDNMPKLTTNEFESGFDDITNSVPIVGEAETTKGATANTSTVHFPGSETQQSYIAFKKALGDDTDTTIQGGGIDGQDEEDHNLTVDTYREQESSVAPMSEAVEEIKYHQKQEMVLTLPVSQKSGAKSLDSGDPIKNSVDVIIRESEQKNTIINKLEMELATCQHHESELQKEVDHLREENEKLEHQLIDQEKETERTREDHEKEIASLESQLKVKKDEVKVAKSQLAVVEKKNEEEKQKLMDAIKVLKDQQNELESTVSKLQDDRKKKEIESRELILSLKEKLNEKQVLENERFKELCVTQVKLAQAEANISRQRELLKDKDLVLAQENKEKLECENQQLKKQNESSQSKLKELEDKLKEQSSSTNLPFQQQSSETESTASASSLKLTTGTQNSQTESGAPSRATSAETAGTETETNAHFNLADDNDSTLDLSKLQNTAQDNDTI